MHQKGKRKESKEEKSEDAVLGNFIKTKQKGFHNWTESSLSP